MIGLAGRFPQADNIAEYWENLKNGKDCVADFSEEEILQEGESESLLKNPLYIKAGAFFQNKKYFDAEFFNYRPDEAELMDPQIRIFHECCWEVLEDSGYSKRNYPDKIGLFAAGTPNVNWQLYSAFKNKGRVDDFSASHLRDVSFLSSKISYQLNLKGPSIFLNTACSSSLVAIHEACNSLLFGECMIALAGGVTIRNYSKKGYVYKQGMINSRDGRCRPFDVNASGTINGEGAGVVALKRLKDALKHRDHIYAIIKGSAINNDGGAKVGYTAPSVNGQAEVIKRAIKMARVAPEAITFVEMHGTATELGDPIEVEALREAFGLKGSQPKSCAIGSVKSNLGHLDSAAGVAGFIKAVLAIYHKELPPSLHFKRPNEKIDFSNGPFFVNTKPRSLKKNTDVLVAGVSSFGIGGTNAHIILEEAPKSEDSENNLRGHHLIVLSAKNAESLEKNTHRLQEHLQKHSNIDLTALSYTLLTGRYRFKYRSAFTCSTRDEAIEKLTSNQFIKQKVADFQEDLQNIFFLFPGQGTQYPAMCKDLYKENELFRTTVDECLLLAKRFSDSDFRTALFPKQNEDSQDESQINNTLYTQPLIFIIEYALAMLLMKLGIRPAYMIGHSIGEFVAACVSGVLSLEDSIRLVIRRAELMATVEHGSMLAAKIDEDKLKPILEKHTGVDLAAVNSESYLVVSGDHTSIKCIEIDLSDSGYSTKRLHTSHAFHSRMMESILTQFEKEVSAVTIRPPEIPYISNYTGEFVTKDEILNPSYWSSHLRNTIQFSRGIELLLRKGNGVFIEVGPGRSLCNFASESRIYNNRHHLVNLTRQLKQEVNDLKYLLEKLGEIWLNGVSVDWEKLYENSKPRRIPLPTYAFVKKAFITDVDAEKLIIDEYQKNGSGEYPGKSNSLIHSHSWQPTLLPNYAPAKLENILIFSDQYGFCECLTPVLTDLGHKIIEVRRGKSFRRIADRIFEMDILDTEQFPVLVQTLQRTEFNVSVILYVGALTEKRGEVDYNQIGCELDAGYLGLCYLSKLIATLESQEEISLLVLNNFLAQITENDEVSPLKSAIHGAARVIPLESRNVACRIIDVPYPFDDAQRKDDYLPKIINEIFYKSDEPFVSYRHNSRWIPAYQSISQHHELSSHTEIKAGETYVITGGLGGIGLTLAEDIVHNNKGHVILAQRSYFPASHDWDTWLAQKGPEDPVSRKIQRILDMQKTGADVQVHQVDVLLEESVRKFIDELNTKGIRVGGLIWAAGEVDFGGIIVNRNYADFIKYLSSKVHGLLLFERYLDFSKLNFIALFSSIGNLFYQSKFGQSSYNAANEFFQSYPLCARKKYGIHVFTINWSDWLDVGITVNAFKRKAKTEDIAWINAQIEKGIHLSEGVSIFHKCLQTKAPVYTIYKGNLAEAVISHRVQYHQELRNINGTDIHEADATKGQDTSTEDQLLQLFSDFFCKEISVNDDFFELGGDSLKGMILTGRINQKLGADVSISDLYKYSTIKLLLDKIEGRIKTGGSVVIPKAPEAEHYALSSGQRRMYILQMLDIESTVYNETQLFWVKGNLEIKKVEDTFRSLIHRHESLRTGFALKDGIPRQFVVEEFQFDIRYFDFNGTKLDETIINFVRPFNLQFPPLYRVGIIQKNDVENLIMIDLHHIIADGISQRLLIKDFVALYNDEVLPKAILQYKDFAEWQQAPGQQEKLGRCREFWLNSFLDLPKVLELPTDLPRPQVKAYRGGSMEFEITSKQTQRLRDIAAKENTSIFMILLAVYNVLLAKLGNQEDIVIGTPIAGRQNAALETMVGMFVNTLPLRNNVKGELSFREFLNILTLHTLECFDNQAYPFESLIDDLQVARGINRNPLFDVMFSYKNMEEPKVILSNLSLEPYNSPETLARFDLTLWGIESEDKLSFSFQYSMELFSKHTIERFIGYFLQIMATVSEDLDTTISNVEIVKGKERKKLVEQLNNTKVFYPKEETIVSLFEKQVRKTPDNVAIRYEEETLSYAELNCEAEKIAWQLREIYGVIRRDLVGVMLQRETLLLPVIFGILKCGAAYVPIDSFFPGERIHTIEADAQLKVLVTRRAFTQGLEYKDTQMLYLDKESLPPEIKGLRPFVSDVTSNDPAYIIYTSGSTGRPKGVVVEHHSVVNRILWMQKKYPITPEDVLLQKTPIVFDVSVWELFWWSFTGASLVLLRPGDEKEPRKIAAIINRRRITTIHFVPSMLSYFLSSIEKSAMRSELKSLRQVFASGEALKVEHVNHFGECIHKQFSTRLINLYGPTEATVDVSYYECVFDKPCSLVPIGKPIDNIQLYILDKDGKLLPYGVAGELCIGGVGVARGYLNDQVLTNEKFVSNPLWPTGRIYRTGDLARILPDENIEYLQRIDHQIKIRGFRVELGDIEAHLSKYPGIRESALMLREKGEEKFLVAYYVADLEVEYTQLRLFLADKLPEYMIPAFGIRLAKMPLTHNGKLDRNALPDPKVEKGKDFVPPSSDTEEKLASIWSEILCIDKNVISVNKNFFELGGQSLKAVSLISKIEKVFNVKMPLMNVFMKPTIRELERNILVTNVSRKQHNALPKVTV